MTRKRWLLAPVYSLLCSLCIGQVAHAGGLDQTTFSPLILFEDGGYAEISAQRRDITVSCALVAAPYVGAQNVLQNRTTLNLGYKQDLGDRMGVALQITTPYAANTAYNAVGYPLEATTATLESRAITALLSYDIGQNAFAYGSLRLLQSDDDIYVSLNAGLPNVFSYRFNGKSDTGLGDVLRLAYSRPEFGTRLALSYTSPIDLTFSGQEGRVFGVEMPATLSLDFQQGIATNTALLAAFNKAVGGDLRSGRTSIPRGHWSHIVMMSCAIIWASSIA